MLKHICLVNKPGGTFQKVNFHSTKRNLKSLSDWYRSLWHFPQVEPPYSHVTQIGDPVLRQKAVPVPKDLIGSREVNILINRMLDVCRKYNCVGLAAPQIGVPVRVIAMEFSEKLKKEFPPAVYEARQMETLPLTVLINPSLKVTNYNKKSFVESCESVKGYAAVVDRYEQVVLTGFTRTGEEQSLELKGWNARIAQHEMDHLDGKIYTDIMDRSTFTCTCWEAVNSKAGRIEIQFHK